MDTISGSPVVVASPAARPPTSRARWWVHLLVLGAYPPLLGLIGWWRGDERGPILASGAAGLAVGCLWELSIFGLVLGVALLASRASASELRVQRRVGWSTVPLGFVYSLGIRLLLGVVVLFGVGVATAVGGFSTERLGAFFQEHRPRVEAIVNVAALRDDPIYRALAVTVVSFGLGGFREELWRAGMLAGFSALWPRYFGSRRGQLGAVAIAAVVFGLGHATQGAMAACFATILGLALGGLIVAHQSIWPAVFAHGFFDATSLVLIPWATSQLRELQKLVHP